MHSRVNNYCGSFALKSDLKLKTNKLVYAKKNLGPNFTILDLHRSEINLGHFSVFSALGLFCLFDVTPIVICITGVLLLQVLIYSTIFLHTERSTSVWWLYLV